MDSELRNLVAKQSNSISQARYRLNPVVRKIVHLVMTKAQTKDALNMTATMPVGEIIRYLRMDSGGKSYEILRRGLEDDILTSLIEVPTDDGYLKFQWFSRLKYNAKKDTIELRLHQDLHPYVIDYQKGFSMIEIAHIAKLQGRHAMRFYELVMAQSGNEGKNGNPPGCWFWQVRLDELRKLFVIGDAEYKRTGDFRTWVIDQPIDEINKAGIGIAIKTEYIRTGRSLIAIKLLVRRVEENVKTVSPMTETEVEDEKLIAAYQDEYNKILAEERQETVLPQFLVGTEEDYYIGKAIKRLRVHVAGLGKKTKSKP